jgi:uncharacterized protein (TIGR00661 family)
LLTKIIEGKKKILVAPLDWGLGHATRCIPVIRELIKAEKEVIIAADNAPLALLQKEFPALKTVKTKGYEINYPANGNMVRSMALQLPKIFWAIYREHNWLQKFIKENNLDLVISDNRYGLFSKKTTTVFLTHQVFVISPVIETFLHRLSLWFIKKHTECWVPDYEEENNFSGKLSHRKKIPKNIKYIGPLSRFKTKQTNSKNEYLYDVLALISGPEPQRSIFEKIVLDELKKTKLKCVILCGKSQENFTEEDGNITIISHAETNRIEELILSSKKIICRSGYTTIMELSALNKKALFIPTPGQTEQEYLAKHHTQYGHRYVLQQNFTSDSLSGD